MSELKARPLAGAMEEVPAGGAGWMCEGRLPYGVTILTGGAGRACARPTLEGVAMEAYAEYAASGCVAGELAETDGGALYVQLGGDERRLARQLSRKFDDGVPQGATFAAWGGKLGSTLAASLQAEVARTGCSLVVVDGASAGTEARQRLTAAIAALSRVGRKGRCAVVLTMPLGPRNWLQVKDPSTGIAAAADAVWEVYPADPGSMCFCTAPGAATSFPVGGSPVPARPPAPTAVSPEEKGTGGFSAASSNQGDRPVI